MTGTIKMKLVVTNQEVTSEYVFETLFKISEKSKDLNHATIAKEIVILAAKRGEKGLFADDWKTIIQKYNLSSHQYFYIIKTLKNAGILRKTKGRYYVIKDFNKHLTKMVTAMNEFYMDIGAANE